MTMTDDKNPTPGGHEPQVGEFVAHYRLDKRLAAGGMGIVFRAYEEGLDRYVAVKILPRNLTSDPEFVRRFLQEARAVANLNHPNVVQIYFTGQQKGMLFFAMELVHGNTLDALVRQRKQLPAREAVGLIRQAAVGLQHALHQGLQHGDIKPANLMVTDTGIVKLTDFGLARQVKLAHLPGETPSLMGTPEYMSPEEAQGEPVDHRSDIYSLGVTLYHLLAGRPPFDNDTPGNIMRAHVEQPPPPVQQFNPQAPAAINRVLDVILAKGPDARYQSYTELIRELDRFLEERPLAVVQPKPIVKPEPQPKPAAVKETKKPKSIVAVVVELVILTSVIIGYFVYRYHVAHPKKPPVAQIQTPAPPGPTDDLAPLAKSTFASLKEKADAKLLLGNYGEALAVYQTWPATRFSQTPQHQAVATERARIRDLAGQALTKAQTKAFDLRRQHSYAEAIAVCEQIGRSLTGIQDYSAEIQKELQLTRKEQATFETEKNNAIAKARAAEYQQKYSVVSGLLLAVRYDDAQQQAQQLAKSDDPVVLEKLVQLQSDVARLAALKQAIIARINTKVSEVMSLATRNAAVKGQICKADAASLTLRQQLDLGTSEVNIQWSELQPAGVTQVFRAYRDRSNADEMLTIGILQFHYALNRQCRPEDAQRVLQSVADTDPSKKPIVDGYLARLNENGSQPRP